MSAKESPRLITKETTGRLKFGGLVAGIIGIIAEISALAVGGIVVASSAVVYDVFRHNKDKKHQGGNHH